MHIRCKYDFTPRCTLLLLNFLSGFFVNVAIGIKVFDYFFYYFSSIEPWV